MLGLEHAARFPKGAVEPEGHEHDHHRTDAPLQAGRGGEQGTELRRIEPVVQAKRSCSEERRQVARVHARQLVEQREEPGASGRGSSHPTIERQRLEERRIGLVWQQKERPNIAG